VSSKKREMLTLHLGMKLDGVYTGVLIHTISCTYTCMRIQKTLSGSIAP
jgi:hypothetical protein